MNALAVLTTGEPIAGGEFTSARGISANYIARRNNAEWRPPGSGATGVVRALAVFPDGDFAVGGFEIEAVEQVVGGAPCP